MTNLNALLATVLLLITSLDFIQSQREIIEKITPQAGPPDVFLMGAQRAATTSLHTYLTKTLGFCDGGSKEYAYWEFNHDNEKTREKYFQNFKSCNPGDVIIDGSNSNSGYIARGNMIKSYPPDDFKKKKFVMILREPIDRMFSYFNSERAKSMGPCHRPGDKSCTTAKGLMENFKEYFEANKYYGVKAGSYVEKIKNLLFDTTMGQKPSTYRQHPLIARHQLFIVNYDALKANPEDILKRIVKFLGATASNYNLPYLNDLQTQLDTLQIKGKKMKCSDYFYFKSIFDDKNKDLLDFINKEEDRPKDEPEFQPFIDKYAEICSHPDAFNEVEEVVELNKDKVKGPPDVFFLGAPKAATTALFQFLTLRAGLCMGTKRDYQYWEFTHRDKSTLDEYFSNFKDCKPGQLTIDGSSSNSEFQARENIMNSFTEEDFHKKKFIYVMREPVDRMYSWYNYERAGAIGSCEGTTDVDCIKNRFAISHLDSFRNYYEHNSFHMKTGTYLDKLTRMMYDVTAGPPRIYVQYPLLPRSQIFVINYETLKYNTTDTLQRLCKFLGVTPDKYELKIVNDLASQLVNFGVKARKMKCGDYLHYKAFYEGKNEGLADFINSHPERPSSEPFFPNFQDIYADRCKSIDPEKEGDEEEDVSSTKDAGKVVGPPDVFFLGAAKAGTTALHAFLTDHAGMCGGTMKEYHYWEFHYSKETIDNYFSQFKECKPGQLTIDGSPSNSGFKARENIMTAFTRDDFLKKRFIFIMREPIDRMFSWYNFERAKSLEPCDEGSNENCEVYKSQYTHLDTFREYYDNNPYYAVKAGAYLEKLTRLMYNVKKGPPHIYVKYPLFPRNQMFLINYDTLKYNTSDTLERISKFLNVKADKFELPYVNDLKSQLTNFGLKEKKMKCGDYLHYKPLFEKENAGLLEFVNNNPLRPPEEPDFVPFIDKYASKCRNFKDGDPDFDE